MKVESKMRKAFIYKGYERGLNGRDSIVFWAGHAVNSIVMMGAMA